MANVIKLLFDSSDNNFNHILVELNRAARLSKSAYMEASLQPIMNNLNQLLLSQKETFQTLCKEDIKWFTTVFSFLKCIWMNNRVCEMNYIIGFRNESGKLVLESVLANYVVISWWDAVVNAEDEFNDETVLAHLDFILSVYEFLNTHMHASNEVLNALQNKLGWSVVVSNNLDEMIRFAVVTLYKFVINRPAYGKEVYLKVSQVAKFGSRFLLQYLVTFIGSNEIISDSVRQKVSKSIIIILRGWLNKGTCPQEFIHDIIKFGSKVFGKISDISKETNVMVFLMSHTCAIIEHAFRHQAASEVQLSIGIKTALLRTLYPVFEFFRNSPQSVKIVMDKSANSPANNSSEIGNISSESLDRDLRKILCIFVRQSESSDIRNGEDMAKIDDIIGLENMLIKSIFSISSFLNYEVEETCGKKKRLSTKNTEGGQSFVKKMLTDEYVSKFLDISAILCDARSHPQYVSSALKLGVFKCSIDENTSATFLTSLNSLGKAAGYPFMVDNTERLFPAMKYVLHRKALSNTDIWFHTSANLFKLYEICLKQNILKPSDVRTIYHCICGPRWDPILNNVNTQILKSDLSISDEVENCAVSVISFFKMLIINKELEDEVGKSDSTFHFIVSRAKNKIFRFVSVLLQALSLKSQTPYFSLREKTKWEESKKQTSLMHKFGVIGSGKVENGNALAAARMRIQLFRLVFAGLDMLNYDYPLQHDVLRGKPIEPPIMAFRLMSPEFKVTNEDQLFNQFIREESDLTFGTPISIATLCLDWMRALYKYESRTSFSAQAVDINCELSYEILQNLLEKMFVHALSLVVNHGLLYLRAMRGNSVLKNKEFWIKYSRIGEVELLHFFAELHLETKNLCRHYDRYKGSEEQAATSTISASTHLTQNTIEGDSSRISMSRLSSKRSLCHSMSYDSILGDEDEPDGMEEIINLLKHEKPFKLRDLLKFVPEEKWSDVDPTYVRNYLDLCGLNDPQVKKLKHLQEFDKPQIASIYPRFSPSKIAARAYSQARIIGVIDSKEKVDWRNNISRVPDTAEKMDISMNDSMRGMCVPKAPAYYVKPSVKASVGEDNSDSWLSTVLKFVWGE